MPQKGDEGRSVTRTATNQCQVSQVCSKTPKQPRASSPWSGLGFRDRLRLARFVKVGIFDARLSWNLANRASEVFQVPAELRPRVLSGR